MKRKKNISKVLIDIQKNVESESLSTENLEELSGGYMVWACERDGVCGKDAGCAKLS